jgi:hypothetical protein
MHLIARKGKIGGAVKLSLTFFFVAKLFSWSPEISLTRSSKMPAVWDGFMLKVVSNDIEVPTTDI